MAGTRAGEENVEVNQRAETSVQKTRRKNECREGRRTKADGRGQQADGEGNGREDREDERIHKQTERSGGGYSCKYEQQRMPQEGGQEEHCTV